MEWPTDVLAQILHALAGQCDTDAQRAWHQLAFLVCNRHELASSARNMPRPILFRIAFDATDSHPAFKIPFMQATVVCIDIDWGDGSIEKVREKGLGYIVHRYARHGTYNVRVFPASCEISSGVGGVWLTILVLFATLDQESILDGGGSH
jgi:hypothetical protein